MSKDFKNLKLTKEDRERLLAKIARLEEDLNEKDADRQEELNFAEAQLQKRLSGEKSATITPPLGSMAKNWRAIEKAICAEKKAEGGGGGVFSLENKKKRYPFTMMGFSLLAAAAAMLFMVHTQKDGSIEPVPSEFTMKGGSKSLGEDFVCDFSLRGKGGNAPLLAKTFIVAAGPIYVVGKCESYALLHLRFETEDEVKELRNIKVDLKTSAMIFEGEPLDLRRDGRAPSKIALYVTQGAISEDVSLQEDWHDVAFLGGVPVDFAISYDVKEVEP